MFTTRGKVHDSEWCVGVSGVGGMVVVGAITPTLTYRPSCVYWTDVLHVLDRCVTCTGLVDDHV